MDAIGKLGQLVVETEGLLDSLADEHGPELDALRERLRDSLEKTKSAIASRGRDGTHQGRDGQHQGRDGKQAEDEISIGLRDIAGSMSDYVSRHPWLALATGVLIAASAGVLATSATRRSFRHGA